MTDLENLLLAEYSLEQFLGQGGYGRVYAAKDKDGKRVAIKLMSIDPEWNNELQASRFRQFHHEAVIMLPLNHPNLVKLLDFDYQSNYYFLVMDLVNGLDLGQILAKKKKLPLEFILMTAIQICYGLQYLHDRQIIHLDIKPANVIMDPRGIIKITDYGNAWLWRFSEHPKRPGTLKFCAPEQLKPKQEIDGRTDLFALGVILYNLVTGIHPFPSDNISELIQQICEYHPNPVISIRPDIPEELSQLIEWSMEKDYLQRPLQVQELKTQLWEILKNRKWKPSEVSFPVFKSLFSYPKN